MGWHQDGQIHITWGSEGEKLSAKDQEKEAATLLADAKARREQHDKADKALEGLPFIAVPIEQLTDIYERMLRLIALGQTSLDEFETLPEPVRLLRLTVFREADFGAVYAGQWLPPHVRKAARDKVRPQLTAVIGSEQRMGIIRTNETSRDRAAVKKVGSDITATLLRLKRASDRHTGCYLTPEMIDALSCSIIAEWWEDAAHDKKHC